KDKPFLLVMQHKAPHRNWQPGPNQLTMYDDVEIPEPPTLFDDYEGRASPASQQEMTIARHLSPFDLKLTPPGNLTEEQARAWNEAYDELNKEFEGLEGVEKVRWMYQRYVKDYLRAVEAVDQSVGALLDRLDELGLADDTIVVYTSDQGWYLGEHGWYDKRWMYEESLRMPLLIRWPKVIEAGSVNDALVQNLDFAPTFLQAAGVEVPGEMQGASFLPMLGGTVPDDWRQSIYYQYFEYPGPHMVHRHRGVRTRNFKLIHYYKVDEWELFDLRTDPNELHSVANDPAYTEIRRALTMELESLMASYGVTDEADQALDERMKR
ncbi:MAG: DUF4976 domain-containing protein, partial [Phycisphaerales bacterium]|nr:DUF4976 domain-containing protein [Phycisphaerales bacterium]